MIQLTTTQLTRMDIIGERVVIFGASENGRRTHDILQKEGIPIDFFTDNDPCTWGKTIHDILVMPPDHLLKEDEQKIIIIASSSFDEIELHLKQTGFQNIYKFTELYALNGFIHQYYGVNDCKERIISHYYETTKEYADKCKQTLYQKIHSAHIVSNIMPKTAENAIHWGFYRTASISFPETFVIHIPGGSVWGRGEIITPDHSLLYDISVPWHYYQPVSSAPVFHRFLPKAAATNETVAVLAASDNNYYHWMYHVLPRFQLLKQSSDYPEIDRYYINYGEMPFQAETLRALGIDSNQIIPSSDALYLQAKHLIVPSFPTNIGEVSQWACDFLRASFLSGSTTNDPTKNKIYISREAAAGRRISNENDLIRLLSAYGFETIYLEKLSFQEQVQTFARAEIIVAPHGAGLANLVFCSEGTKVIEIFHPGYVVTCYHSLSNRMNLDYYYVLGEGAQSAKYRLVFQHDNIVINIKKIEALLNQMAAD